MAQETEHKREYKKIKAGTRLAKYRNAIDSLSQDTEILDDKRATDLTRRKPTKIPKMHVDSVAHRARAKEHREIGYDRNNYLHKRGR